MRPATSSATATATAASSATATATAASATSTADHYLMGGLDRCIGQYIGRCSAEYQLILDLVSTYVSTNILRGSLILDRYSLILTIKELYSFCLTLAVVVVKNVLFSMKSKH